MCMFPARSLWRTAEKREISFVKTSTSTYSIGIHYREITHDLHKSIANTLQWFPDVQSTPQFVQILLMNFQNGRHHQEYLVNYLAIDNCRIFLRFQRIQIFLWRQEWLWFREKQINIDKLFIVIGRNSACIYIDEKVPLAAPLTFTTVSNDSTYDFSVLNNSTTTCVLVSCGIWIKMKFEI